MRWSELRDAFRRATHEVEDGCSDCKHRHKPAHAGSALVTTRERHSYACHARKVQNTLLDDEVVESASLVPRECERAAAEVERLDGAQEGEYGGARFKDADAD
jgi:hypothetical protein